MSSITSTSNPSQVTLYIKTAKSHANPEWLESAIATVKRLARRCRTLISADVLAELKKSAVKTHDLRAIGSVMTEARKLGYIENAGFVRRGDKHTRGTTVLWRSLLFQHPQAESTKQ